MHLQSQQQVQGVAGGVAVCSMLRQCMHHVADLQAALEAATHCCLVTDQCTNVLCASLTQQGHECCSSGTAAGHVSSSGLGMGQHVHGLDTSMKGMHGIELSQL